MNSKILGSIFLVFAGIASIPFFIKVFGDSTDAQFASICVAPLVAALLFTLAVVTLRGYKKKGDNKFKTMATPKKK
jgi:hypothetical protein